MDIISEKIIEEYCKRGEYAEALKIAKNWISSEQTEPRAYAKLAFVYNFLGQTREAVTTINKAIELAVFPQPALFFSKALYLFKDGNYEECKSALMDCRKSSVDGYYLQAASLGLAKVQYLTSSYRDALESLSGVNNDASMWMGEPVTASGLRAEIIRSLRG
jgi:tetratricopeptide (TPR) repeat protein